MKLRCMVNLIYKKNKEKTTQTKDTITKMKVNITETVETTTNSDSTRMTFDENSHIFLIDVLTNLYSNPELAVLREYTSNGLDSHTASGQTLPVELTMPTIDNPTFVVKDYGLGMSRQELDEIYSRYGASTKRDSNTQIGGFGLGAKSALTITSSFTITSVKDGEKNIVVVAKDDDGVGSLNYLITEKTDEPNGVEVAIPVRNISKFNEESINFFLGIDTNAILVNGERIENSLYNSEKWTQIGDFGWFDEKNLMSSNQYSGRYYGRQEARVKVGPAIYTLDNNTGNLFERYNSLISTNAHNIVINLPIGSVDLTPSREGLRYSDKTVTAIKTAIENYEAALRKVVSGILESKETRKDAAIFWQVANRFDFKLPAEWHGEVIPETVSFAENTTFTVTTANGSKTSSSKVYTAVRLADFASPSNFTHPIRMVMTEDAQREKIVKNLKDYAKAIGQNSVTAYLVKEGTEIHDWFEDIVTETTVDEVYETALQYRRDNRKTSTRSGNRVVSPVSYITFDTSNTQNIALAKTPATSIVADPLYILEDEMGLGTIVRGVKGNITSTGYYSNRFEIIRSLVPNRTIVLLPNTMSTDRFLKLFPKAEQLKFALFTEITDAVTNLTPIEKAVIKEQQTSSQANTVFFQKIAEAGMVDKIDNAEIRERINIYANPAKFAFLLHLSRINQLNVEMLNTLVEDIDNLEVNTISFENKYPMLQSAHRIDSIPVTHIVAYINMVETM